MIAELEYEMKQWAVHQAEERPVFVNGYVLLACPNCFPPRINDVSVDLYWSYATNFAVNVTNFITRLGSNLFSSVQ